MFERPQYSDNRSGPVLALLKANPLALVVTSGESAPLATHAPVLFRHGPDGADEETVAEDGTSLVGATLVGHMDIRNPQWTAMREGDRALVVCQGPHGYVSPTVYGVTPAAPTWDFTAVHIVGSLRPVVDPAEVLEIVGETARRLEADFGQGWDQESSVDYFRRIAPGVGAFELQVESVQTMFKLSQEKPAPMRRRIVEDFEGSESGTHRNLAALMRSRGIVGPGEEPEALI
ncbi:FMN-binding negative transcriptional regulator [Streptomyces sp. NPDC054884]|uniref:FMN-binding negative transcriptional regulator n=1 Tax=Streptomyces sp. ME08-AFT2 TaxID=3028683 RepID=UPI0029A89D1F|nr:FMN-binding negative transcriptional regulator [Streptomyces sp. ME08-AFT2]MDX3312688.1 FMN-binding negative transcriptional regulator [Streptomyces sp. ME08-AFT2]